MKRKLKWTSNWGLKIGSILFALVLWLFVTNVNDPITSHTIPNVQVKLLNTELLAEAGRVYTVLEESDVIDVTIRAPRSVTGYFNGNSVIATADVKELSSLDTITIKLETNNIYSGSIESITGSHELVKLDVEEKTSNRLVLEAITTGTVEEGYKVGTVVPEENLVIIEGPQSLIDEVKRAVVAVEVTGITSDIATNATIKLFDKDNRTINSSRITKNINAVRVNVNILQTKQVGLRYDITGTPAVGYRQTGEIISLPETILIAGKSSLVKDIMAIEIPSDVLDINGMNEDYQKVINISEYMPENIVFGDEDFDGNVTVTIKIEPEISKTVLVRESNVQLVNVPEGFTGKTIELDEPFRLNLIGLTDELNPVTSNSLQGTVDIEKLVTDREMGELEAGYYTVEVSFDLSENITILEPMEITVHITEDEP